MGKTLKGLIERTRRSNAAFAQAPMDRQRVIIAKDVIAAIDARTLKPRRGTYTGGTVAEVGDRIGDDVSARDDFRNLMSTLPACEACAKGAIFLCVVARRDKLTVSGAANISWRGYDLARALGGIFSANQLDGIESAFEHADGLPLDADGWGANKRMKWIMRNIIKNRGTFVPVLVG